MRTRAARSWASIGRTIIGPDPSGGSRVRSRGRGHHRGMAGPAGGLLSQGQLQKGLEKNQSDIHQSSSFLDFKFSDALDFLLLLIFAEISRF